MSTNLDKIFDCTYNEEDLSDLSINELKKKIFDFSESPNTHIKCLERLNILDEMEFADICAGLRQKYIYNQTEALGKILKFLVEKSSLPTVSKYSITITLISTAERQIKNESDDVLPKIKEFNRERVINSYDVSKSLCNREYNNLATPCKLDIIFNFLKKIENFPYFTNYMKIILEENHPSSYKYDNIKSLEKKSKDLTENSIFYEKNDKDYSKSLYDIFTECYLYLLRVDNFVVEFKILVCQYLFQRNISDECKKECKDYLLSIFDKDHKEQIIADAADVLLSCEDEYYIQKAQQMILKLGFKDTKSKTVFDNSQNVHVQEIGESAVEILEYLCSVKREEKEEPTFDVIYKQIQEDIKSPEYYIEEEDRDKINIALMRIIRDNAFYSKLCCTLENILIKVWCYIQNHSLKEELYKRLLEELIDMAGWCSSGNAFRLLNTLSGFGQFSLKISFCDQVVSNFSGRFMARIKNINDDELREKIITGFTTNINDDIELKRIFNKFFMENMPYIREEMYTEFKEFMSDEDFDFAFRKAITQYIEGVKFE